VAKEKIHVPVLIVGGGPVGLAIAVDLGLRNVRCLLVNIGKDTTDIPKVGTVSARTMEHFRRWGVSNRLRSGGLPENHPTDVVFCTRYTGIELARLSMPPNAETVRQARRGGRALANGGTAVPGLADSGRALPEGAV